MPLHAYASTNNTHTHTHTHTHTSLHTHTQHASTYANYICTHTFAHEHIHESTHTRTNTHIRSHTPNQHANAQARTCRAVISNPGRPLTASSTWLPKGGFLPIIDCILDKPRTHTCSPHGRQTQTHANTHTCTRNTRACTRTHLPRCDFEPRETADRVLDLVAEGRVPPHNLFHFGRGKERNQGELWRVSE